MFNPYPSIDDEKFYSKLISKKEFRKNALKLSKKTQEEACSQTMFNLFEHQRLVRNFLSPHTPYQNLLLFHDVGMGKCHEKDTPILMYDGSIKKVQDIIIGDQIMGDDSTPRQVLSLGSGKDTMYEIKPVKGESFTVNSEHILCLKITNTGIAYVNDKRCNTKKKYVSRIMNKSTYKFKCKGVETKHECQEYIDMMKNTEEDVIIEIPVNKYLELSKYTRNQLKLYRKGVDFKPRDINFDPYIIGLWLGDGSKRDPVITNQDSVIIKYLKEALPQYNLSLNFQCGYDYRISGIDRKNGNYMLQILQELNLINNKHIPDIYKINSREVRLQLLAGLIDSDGHYTNNCYEITQIRENLADDILFLSRSLGFAAYKKQKKTSWSHNGEKKYSNIFKIIISGDIIEIPCKIKRKIALELNQVKDVLVTGFSVEEKAVDDYYGFTLDSNHRYLMGDFTVTHNTCSAISIAESHKDIISSYNQKIIILLEDSVKQNFINELYNESKDENQCTGTTYQNMSVNARKKYIKGQYKFKTLDKFTNEICKLSKTKKGREIIRDTYSNTIIINDEVHNVREYDAIHNKKDHDCKRYDALLNVVTLANNSKLLLMSATPMFDNPREIVSLMNLFLLNEQNDLNLSDIKKYSINVKDVFNSDDNLTSNGQKILEKKLKGVVSYVRGDNPTTFPSMQFNKQSKTYPFLKKLKLIETPMSLYHQEQYLKNINENVNIIRQESNIHMGDNDPNTALLEQNLKNKKNSVSIKFYTLLKNLKLPGLSFIYSEFISNSLKLIEKMLTLNGYEQYTGKNKSNKKTYVLLEGRIDTKQRVKILNIFNSPENKDGKIIKVILGSRVLKEGITLKNIRNVHIIEPWHNMSRLKQVWGRAIRSCSHVVLPPSKRSVDIFLYTSTFQNTPISQSFYKKPYNEIKKLIPYDIYAYKRSENKEIKIEKVVNVLRSIAIDCELHKNYNRNDNDGIQCQKTQITHDDTTYQHHDDFFNQPEIDLIIRQIKMEIKKNLIYKITKLNEEVENAIYQLLPKSNDLSTFPHILKINGQQGYIIKRSSYLIFQPLDNNVLNKSNREKMSMYERKHPKAKIFKQTALKPIRNLQRIIDNVPESQEIVPVSRGREKITIIKNDSIKGNYKGLLRSDGSLSLQKLEPNITDLRVKSRGRVCTTQDAQSLFDITKNIKIAPEKVNKFFIRDNSGKLTIKGKRKLCQTITDFFYPNILESIPSSASSSRRSSLEILKEKQINSFIFRIVKKGNKEVLKIDDTRTVSRRGGIVCFTIKEPVITEISKLLKIPFDNKKQFCNAITEKLFG